LRPGKDTMNAGMSHQPVALTDIAFACEVEALGQRLRLKSGTPGARRLAAMVRQAQAVARPKALYRAAEVRYEDGDQVVLDGVVFTSAILRRAMQNAPTAFPFLATCGRELEAWAARAGGPLQHYWANVIMGMALEQATEALKRHITRHYGLRQTNLLEPGVPADWPATELKGLHALLGDTLRLAGVQLNREGMMTPLQSVSGLLFPAKAALGKCMLCPRDHCPERAMAYEPDRME
jgi:hypothetical protein